MKHGPLALVDEHLPIVVVATRDSMYSKMESVIQQLLARNAQLVILCTEGDENMKQYVDGYKCQLIEVRVVCFVCVDTCGGSEHMRGLTLGVFAGPMTVFVQHANLSQNLYD